MKAQKEKWESLEKVWEVLNQHCEYVVLRNFDSLNEQNLMAGNGDIDILCRNVSDCVKVLHAYSRGKRDNGINYQINVGDGRIAIDFRVIGDGYYCEKWEEQLIQNRVKNEQGVYILNPKDYFYSLIYHAVFQKKTVKPAYESLLLKMADEMDVNAKCLDDLILQLEKYMRENHYYYSNTKDPEVVLNYKAVSKSIVKKNMKWIFLKIIYEILCRLGLY